MIEWIEDREKNGEMYVNSMCFTYCLKCFKPEKKIELWCTKKGVGTGFSKQFPTEAEAILAYRGLKTMDERSIESFVEKNFSKIS